MGTPQVEPRVSGFRVRALVLVALATCFLAISAAFGTFGASAQEAKVVPGELVAVDRQNNQLIAVGSDGKQRPVPATLTSPVAVAALGDGSILIAEADNARIVGHLGRYALGTPLVAAAGVEAMVTGADGKVYVTQADGTVSSIVLDGENSRLEKITGGLRGPKGIAERGGFLYVAESGAGEVAKIATADGSKTVAATALGRPVGVAIGPGQSLFVSDAAGRRIVRIDEAAAPVLWASLDAGQLAVEPAAPTAEKFTIVATTPTGLTRFDANAQRLLTVPMASAAGVATVPAADTVPVALGETATTRAGRATNTPPRTEALETRSGTSTFALIASLAILALIAVAGGVFYLLHESKGSAEAGFEERPLDTDSVFEAFGPHAAEEVELAEAEGGLRAVVVQRQASERRAEDAARRHAEAKELLHRSSQARSKATRARQMRAKAGQGEPAPALRTAELGLRTAMGRDALDQFRAHEIDARELEDLWRDAGERQAVECVQVIGAVLAAGGKLSIDEVRAARAEERARRQLADADHDREHAALEIDRLREREAAAVKRIRDARRSLDAAKTGAGGRHRGRLNRTPVTDPEALATLPPPPGSSATAPSAPSAPATREPVHAGVRRDHAAVERDAVIDLRKQQVAAAARPAPPAARPAPPAPRPAPPAARPAPPRPAPSDDARRAPVSAPVGRADAPRPANGRPVNGGPVSGRPADGSGPAPRPATPTPAGRPAANGRPAPAGPAAPRPGNGRPPARPATPDGRPAAPAARPPAPAARPAANGRPGPAGPAAPRPGNGRPAGRPAAPDGRPGPRPVNAPGRPGAGPRPVAAPGPRPVPAGWPTPVASGAGRGPVGRTDDARPAVPTPSALVHQAKAADRGARAGRINGGGRPNGRPVGPPTGETLAADGRGARPAAVLSTSNDVAASRRRGGPGPVGN